MTYTSRRARLFSALFLVASAATAAAQEGAAMPQVPTPTDVRPGSATCDECPYPYPSKYFDLNVYSQPVRMSYMDVPAQGTANGRTVVLLHGNNFGGFYFGVMIDALTKEGFRVVVPDQIGYGRSSKPIAPYNFNSQVRNTYSLLQHLKIDRVSIVGHSMGGMMTARFATQFPKAVDRIVIYNPIGLTDGRYARPQTPIDEAYASNLKSTYQSTRAGLFRYVAHNPKAWNDEFEKYARIRYSWSLSSEWPRLAMVQALISQMLYNDPVVYDWQHIQVPTLAFGGAEDMLLGPASAFQERMAFLAKSVPNGKGRVHLIPGLGHVPHLEDPGKVLPPLVAFLKEQ